MADTFAVVVGRAPAPMADRAVARAAGADLRKAAAAGARAAAAPRRETNDSGPLTDHPTTAPPAFARWKRPERAVRPSVFDRLAAGPQGPLVNLTTQNSRPSSLVGPAAPPAARARKSDSWKPCVSVLLGRPTGRVFSISRPSLANRHGKTS